MKIMKPKRKATPATKPKRQPSATRPRPITAAQARRIAARFDAARRFAGATVKPAVGGTYGTGTPRRDAVWLVFPNPTVGDACRLGPSEVIAVNQRTGRVLYAGQSHDEG
jgi:hypothetical protein